MISANAQTAETYVIRTLEGPVRFKIGTTNDPDKRFKSINAMSPVKLKMVCHSHSVKEQFAHAHCVKVHVKGEWFDESVEVDHVIAAMRKGVAL